MTADGYASETLTVSLSAGQKLTGLAITLSRSSASLRGRVGLVAGTGGTAGGVGVTVTNGLLTIQTVTASTADVGSWQVSGLAIPGTYTVTFARVDLQSQTVSVSLDAAGTGAADALVETFAQLDDLLVSLGPNTSGA